ncbi:Phosphoenolpyruvate-protein phosphotransferase [Pontiella desulfatans]|uniref:Phosphoenolpyruvate-protein phosphotransferase n=1 Tax=Pontiella desulfatans TaxID=2750659 RepID=A0A6C2UBE9_PONDE|nr:phosphoenolpyruvate--protein phosphotransferase [Pontiella desulfatans]VGO16616.1 Phosphoenolpyruvate-protein phosphotransferase [Pontiella desulfatans]
MTDKAQTLILEGIPVSPGLAEGAIHLQHTLLGPIDTPEPVGQGGVEEEFSRLDAATASISNDLLALATRVEKEIDTRLSGVFEAHQLMANDPSLREELRREIAENLISAGSAVKTVFLRWEKRFLLMESQIARDKSDDMHDVAIRLRNALAGITVHPLDRIPHGCVLAVSRLLPSDTVFLASRSIAAVLLEHGSVASHAALFAREMGLPCISKLPNLLSTASNGAWALVDADTGTVTFHPREQQKEIFRKKVEDKERSYAYARERAAIPATTKDGITVSVLANVCCNEDTKKAMLNGAKGVGLYRMEQAYLGCVMPPGTDELLNEMRWTLEAAKGRPVIVRLLDIGADKPLPFIRFLAESNPSLGRRGIRLLREYPELLKTHLRAVLELSREFDVRVLVPMVTLPEDVAVVKKCLTELGAELDISPLPRLGAMIETPAAALSARKLAPHVDFLSFGTNDLTQYAFAADRENAAVEQYFDDASDVIFRLMQATHEDVPEMPLSVCGELAGRPEHIPRLLQCGIRTLSVAPALVPMVKEAIRKSTCGKPANKRG